MSAKKKSLDAIRDSRKEIKSGFITLAILLFVIFAIQYIPLIALTFKIKDVIIGRVMVYSLPVFIGYVFYRIWKS